MAEIQTLEQAERYAAQYGIDLKPADRDRIAKAQRAELDRLRALEDQPAPQGMVARVIEGFNRYYPRFLESLYAVSDVLLTLAQTLIVAFGIPATLCLLLVVEHQRVMHGIQLFELDLSLASFFAVALVVLNLVLEFQIHYVEQRAGYEQARDKRFSLRIAGSNLMYLLGAGKEWKELTLSPAARYRRLLRLVTFTILALALAGSMKTTMEETVGTWHEAIIKIVTESKLIDMMTWLGGLLAALAAVLSAQGLSRYVALRCAEIAVRMQAKSNDEGTASRYEAEVSAAGAQVVLALIQQKLERRAAATSNPTIQPVPELTPIFTVPNGNGNGRGNHVRGEN